MFSDSLLKDHNGLTATGSQAGIDGSGWGNITIVSCCDASLLVQGGFNSPTCRREWWSECSMNWEWIQSKQSVKRFSD
jgi:hypothetical protein